MQYNDRVMNPETLAPPDLQKHVLSPRELLLRRLARPDSYKGLFAVPGEKLKWHKIDKTIRDYSRTKENDMTVLQIGANDGIHSDPINKYIVNLGWSGVLVEPVPSNFEELKQTYKDKPNVRLLQAAITDKDGTVAMHTPLRHADSSPLRGKDSMHRSVINKHRWLVYDFDELVEEIEVPALSVPSLLAITGLVEIDFLAVDTEGHDAVILNQFDLEKSPPHFILYEHCHLPSADQKDIANRLGDIGYSTTELRRDTFATL